MATTQRKAKHLKETTMITRHIQRLATLVALVALTLTTACFPPLNPQPNVVTLGVGETVAHSTTKQFITIASEYAWSIEIDYLTPEGTEGWCSLSKTNGEGNDIVKMNFGANTLDVSRSLTLRVKFPREDVEILFTQLAAGEEPTPEPSITTTPKWLELPAFTADNQEVYFSKHMLASSGYTARSFSLLYDSRIYHSLWVAYPISKLHTPGGGSRKDDWGRMDSNIPTSKQVFLGSSFNGSYDRGHLCPAATRFHPNTQENCMQLSIPTNMSPQLSGLNQQKWAGIEGQVRGWGSSCDTLYVVTGAVFRTVGGNESISYAYGKSDSGKQVSVPNYYYKALLQRRGTGSSSAYQAMAIWVPHKAAMGNATKNDIITIDRLEELTGIDFFHNLDDATEQRVESYYDLTYWGGIN